MRYTCYLLRFTAGLTRSSEPGCGEGGVSVLAGTGGGVARGFLRLVLRHVHLFVGGEWGEGRFAARWR